MHTHTLWTKMHIRHAAIRSRSKTCWRAKFQPDTVFIGGWWLGLWYTEQPSGPSKQSDQKQPKGGKRTFCIFMWFFSSFQKQITHGKRIKLGELIGLSVNSNLYGETEPCASSCRLLSCQEQIIILKVCWSHTPPVQFEVWEIESVECFCKIGTSKEKQNGNAVGGSCV